MSLVCVTPSPIAGSLSPPPSKSAAHRALIAAALAGGGTVRGLQMSEDIAATLRALRSLGAEASLTGDTAVLRQGAVPAEAVVDCGESGSTLRFMIPLFLAKGIPAVFTGGGRLPQRPLGMYSELLPAHGARLTRLSSAPADFLPLRAEGRLRGGVYRLPGDVSSQFVTGLLYALPLCEEESEIRLTTPLESAGYVEMTLSALRRAGIVAESRVDGWRIPGGQRYHPADVMVEGDWSQAAFLLAAGALGGEITVEGMDPASRQGDRACVELFRRFGAEIDEIGGRYRCRRAPLHGIDIDARQIPDLVPVLAATAALAEGTTRITGAARLRLKESDRLTAMANGLTRLGAQVEEQPDGLLIHGVGRLQGGEAEGCNDHRVVMSLAVAALGCDAPVTISDAQSVAKSWPAFFQDYQQIGGIAHVIRDR